MSTPSPLSSPTSPTSPSMRRKPLFRQIERGCCTALSLFPLLFVYGLSTWAVYVCISVSFLGNPSPFLAYPKAILSFALYAIANVSYTLAVFTPPGSPLDPREDLSVSAAGSWRGKWGGRGKRGGYQGLPTFEPRDEGGNGGGEGGEEQMPAHANMTTVTAKSTGRPRFCKKCNCVKPDRTHHCSTCGKCVLKMDHHCPWLATCVGLRNYKPFLLFLIYTSLFCWFCFGVTAYWVYFAIFSSSHMQDEGLMVVHIILLAVLGGIIGLVLSGFTGWHVYLAVTGSTTIESLEKTRYLSPLRKSLERQSHPERTYLSSQPGQPHDQEQDSTQPPSFLDTPKQTHANALPGILRAEEGETSRTPSPLPPSPARDSLQNSYAALEAQREQARYAAYLDETDSESLPNAFDLGWRRNLLHIFGPEPLLWGLPVCNTSGDGWMWDVSPKWTEASAELARRREERERQNVGWGGSGGAGVPAERVRKDYRWTPGQGFVDQNAHFGAGGGGTGQMQMQMQPLDRRKSSREDDGYESSSDEDVQRRALGGRANGNAGPAGQWNDVPEEMLVPRGGDGRRSRSRGRRKGD